MKSFLLNNKISSSIVVGFVLVGLAFAQTSNSKIKRNSPFAPNPKGRAELAKATNNEAQNNNAARKPASVEQPNTKAENTASVVSESANDPGGGEADSQPSSSTTANAGVVKAAFENDPAAKKNAETAKKTSSVAPSEIYKIGVGDILFISLQNAPSKESTYFTVLKDGTIDYPLAGEMVSVLGLTTDEIEAALREKIKLYENPQVSVKVREHNSHNYTVLGMVEKPGEKFLQREAYPLLVVKAEAIVEPKADRAVIKRHDSQTEIIDLKDAKSDDVLIFSGDIVEFTASENANLNGEKQFYYIGGEINSGGQRDFYKGITLTQAILASGGLKKQSARKVVIRRKNEAGMLTPTNYDLKAVKDGKAADPTLEAGDTIEIGN
ncbi:MAG: polysaccharide biosynthesis/export family protein [Pyrinomonadaceae bacterium]